MTDWNRYREIDALREAGHPAEALVELKTLRASAADAIDVSSILLGQALAYRDLGCFNKAVEAALEAVSLLPREHSNRPYAEFVLASAHGDEGRCDLEAEELRSILSKYADFWGEDENIQLRRDAQRRLIADLIYLGHAIEPLSIINALKTEEISVGERAELLYREAQAYRLLDRPDHALELYQQAASGPLQRSQAARAHFEIGLVLYDRGKFRQALDEFKTAESLCEPDSPDKDAFAGWVKHTVAAVNKLPASG